MQRAKHMDFPESASYADWRDCAFSPKSYILELSKIYNNFLNSVSLRKVALVFACWVASTLPTLQEFNSLQNNFPAKKFGSISWLSWRELL